MANHWIGVVSRDHVQRGVRGGFIQLNHGKKSAVQRLRAGDFIAIYSPRTDYPDGEPLQAFTALGRVLTGEVYRVRMTEDFEPYRVDVQFAACREALARGRHLRPAAPSRLRAHGRGFRCGGCYFATSVVACVVAHSSA